MPEKSVTGKISLEGPPVLVLGQPQGTPRRLTLFKRLYEAATAALAQDLANTPGHSRKTWDSLGFEKFLRPRPQIGPSAGWDTDTDVPGKTSGEQSQRDGEFGYKRGFLSGSEWLMGFEMALHACGRHRVAAESAVLPARQSWSSSRACPLLVLLLSCPFLR